MTDNESKALKDFLLDINCLSALDNWKDEVNIFDILKITNAEIRHSNILSWLLDPNENHGIGISFIREFITRIIQRCPKDKCDPFAILLQDFFTYQVYREANHMDLVLVSKEEKTVIIIENKIWSGESPSQLKTYMNKSRSEYSDCEHFLYVFLTPDGYDSSDPENWISISYEEVINALEVSIKDKHLKNEVALIINNYIKVVREKIMKEKDQELLKICNEIYNKHQTALKLIFENVNIHLSADSELICNELKKMSDEGTIIYADNNRWGFSTQEMDEFLPPLNNPDSSWGTDYVYWYWFEKFDDSLVIHFELGYWNVSDEHKKRMQALIEAAGKKNEINRFKRLYYKKVKINQNDYEDKLAKAIRSLVKSALDNEKALLTKAKEIIDSNN